MTNSLERIRNLAVQAANGAYSSSERQMEILRHCLQALGMQERGIHQERFSSLKSVKRAFGSATTLIGLQIGDDSNTISKIDLNTALGLGNIDFSISDKTSSLSTINRAEQIMTFLNTMGSNIGSSINKLSSVVNIQDNRILNLSASKSTINDSDIAIESANLVKSQIKNQAATTLMAQTKNLDKNLLMSLLGE